MWKRQKLNHNFKYELTTIDILTSKKEKQTGLRGGKRKIKRETLGKKA